MVKSKKAVSVLLAVMLFTTLAAGRQPVYAAVFPDLADATYENAVNAIQQWHDYGVIGGNEDGTFRPLEYFQRYQIAVMIARIMGYAQEAPNQYTDVTGSEVFAPYLLQCAAAGVFDAGGAFRPYDDITREEAALAFARALGVETNAGGLSAVPFVDEADISITALGAVKAMSERGIISGGMTDNGMAFRPKEKITRQDMMVLFTMAIDALVSGDGAAASNRAFPRSVVVNAPGAVISSTHIEGDLIIAEGVGGGTVTLDNVTVNGRLIVRADGANTVLLTGACGIQQTLMNKKNDETTTITLSAQTAFGDVTIQGGQLSITAADGAEAVIGDIRIAAKTDFTTGEGISVGRLTADLLASGSTVRIGGSAGALNLSGNHVRVSVAGTAAEVTVTGNQVAVDVGGLSGEATVTGKESVVTNLSEPAAEVAVEPAEEEEATEGEEDEAAAEETPTPTPRRRVSLNNGPTPTPQPASSGNTNSSTNSNVPYYPPYPPVIGGRPNPTANPTPIPTPIPGDPTPTPSATPEYNVSFTQNDFGDRVLTVTDKDGNKVDVDGTIEIDGLPYPITDGTAMAPGGDTGVNTGKDYALTVDGQTSQGTTTDGR